MVDGVCNLWGLRGLDEDSTNQDSITGGFFRQGYMASDAVDGAWRV